MITFRKLYSEPKEGEENNSIIAYAKRADIVTDKKMNLTLVAHQRKHIILLSINIENG